MQIKKFVAQTLREATEKMKDEFGTEAVILGTRVIEADLKLGIKKMFEITAGIEDEGESEAKVKSLSKSKINLHPQKSFEEELNEINNKIYSKAKTPSIKASSSDKQPAKIEPKGGKLELESELKEIINTLVQKEVQKTIITEVLDQLKKYQHLLTRENLESYTLSCLSSLLSTSDFELKPQKKTKTVVLIGPTGVGKTTSIAKLALIAKIIHNLDVGLISVDTYRLGALDQLRIFSEVSHIDMLAAYEPHEMPELMKKFSKKDIVFIDTAGRSPQNVNQLKKNLEFVKNISVDETMLVLSATSSTRNLIDTAGKFKMFNYGSYIFSKIDESVAHGNILNLVSSTGIPVVFLTNGQVIPDDIIAADSDFIAKLIYSDKISK
ncbi:MAG: flagellar biosynthesis protein FlhF [Ignavibacteria bacterium]|jgi:flagellar biosynthesis protein FlhF|nr:flagellar biosynthesis protein FlhF [Ignavibacteria bacterium]